MNTMASAKILLGPHLNFLASWPDAGPREPTQEARLRGLVEPTRTLCIIASSRNEGAYLLEWLAYHIEIGVEAFFLYSNNDDDGSDVLLRRLADAEVVSYRESDGQACAPQYKAYSHALKAVPQVLDYEWALVIDLDEYVVLNRSRFTDARQFLASVDADVVSLNWHMFGVFGQERADLYRPLAERLTLRFPDVNPHTKSAFRPRFCEHSHAHYPFASGVRPLRRVDASGADHVSRPDEPALSQTPLEGGAWINHYWTKSLEELRLKFGSNTGDQPIEQRRTPEEVQGKIEEHLAIEASQTPVEDRRIQVMLPRVKARMAELLALPGVRDAYEAVIEHRKAQIAYCVA